MRRAEYGHPLLPQRNVPTLLATSIPVGLTFILSLFEGCGNKNYFTFFLIGLEGYDQRVSLTLGRGGDCGKPETASPVGIAI